MFDGSSDPVVPTDLAARGFARAESLGELLVCGYTEGATDPLSRSSHHNEEVDLGAATLAAARGLGQVAPVASPGGPDERSGAVGPVLVDGGEDARLRLVGLHEMGLRVRTRLWGGRVSLGVATPA